jgi:hypothetical protein
VLSQLRQAHAVCAINFPAHRIAESADIRMQKMRLGYYGRSGGSSFGNGREIHAGVTASHN